MENAVCSLGSEQKVGNRAAVFHIPFKGEKALGKLVLLLAAAGIGAIANTTALADVVFSGTNSSQNLSASVGFSLLGGGELQISLTNTYGGDTADQGHVLTGIFFSGADNLTRVSATATGTSVEWIGTNSYVPPPSSAVLGQEWAYATEPHAPGNATSGIVSSGYYNNVGMGNFATNGDMLDGSSYGLLSKGYAGSDMDGLDDRQYIQDSIVFVLGGFTGSLSNITNVSFQYGTSLSEPALIDVQVVPEPGSVALLGLGLAAILIFRRRVRFLHYGTFTFARARRRR
jgi:hypothetical protein